MAIPNLFQKSDANLAAMAYKMADAKTPPDMSKVFGRMADSYDRTMRATTQAWGSVIQSVTPLVAHAAKNFARSEKMVNTASGTLYENEDKTNMFMNGFTRQIKNPKYVAPEDTGKPGYLLTPDTSDDPKIGPQQEPEFIEEKFMGLNEISDELRKTWTQGKPLSRENKARRLELRKLKADRFAEVELIESGLRSLSTSMSSNNYEEGVLNSDSARARMLGAVSAMYTPYGKIAEGDFAGEYVDFGRNKQGDLTLNLFGKDGKPVYKDVTNGKLEQMSIAVPDIPSLLPPKLSAQQVKPFTDSFNELVKAASQPGSNLTEVGSAFDYAYEQQMPSGDAFVTLMNNSRVFEGQRGSFVDNVMGNRGRGGSLSATIFSGLSAALPVGGDGNPIVPTNDKGEQIPLNLGENGYFDATDFADPAYGAQNYTKIAQALTNPSSTYYNEDLSKKMFGHFMKTEALDKAKIARGQTLARSSWWGEIDTQAKQRSQAIGKNMMEAVTQGNFDNLILPPLKKGGPIGTIKWVDVKDRQPTKSDKAVLQRDGEKDITFYPFNNNHVARILQGEGVLPSHMNNMANFKDPRTGKNIFDFSKPLWGSANPVNQIYNQE